MPATSDSALLLAGQLRSLSDPELAALLAAREVRAAGIHDFFDLADALLEPGSVQAALARLDRHVLSVLASLAALGAATPERVAADLRQRGAPTIDVPHALDTGVRLALVARAGDLVTAASAVGDRFAEWPSVGLPSLHELVSDPAPATLTPVRQVDTSALDQLAAERAFGTTAAVAELISQLHHESARELARGGIALPDSKRLAAAMNVDLDQVPGLLEIADRAGLIAQDGGRWLAAEAGVQWLVDSSGHRWSLLSTAWLERLPADVRAILAARSHGEWGERLDQYTSWLFPAGGEWMRDRIAVYTRDAELLGITADHVPSTPGVALLTSGSAAAASAMSALFPPEVDQVYVQHDLSIVSPGPLAPRVDARLRVLADLEARALASTYRVSAASLTRAMASGETAEGIREFLSEISLTGIPQPLDYLIGEAAARFGLVRVRAEENGQSSVYSSDPSILRTLLVDHTIAPLGLVRTAEGLRSRFDRDVVFWSLSEARYPVAAEDSDGQIVVPERRRAERSRPMAPDTTHTLVERLRLGSSDPVDTQDAWLARQLDVAIRGKMVVTVTVRMPDGSTADYQLEPASVAGGRLRARDRKADLERTLPLASIAAVGPASPAG